MTSTANNQLCRQRRKARGGLFASIKDTLSLHLMDHIASCPRCRQRIAKLGRVELALQMMLSQPHSLSLLQEANEAALNKLRRQERLSPKADTLRQTTPQPDWTARHTKRLEKLLGVAACLAVICLIKVGVFSSLKDIHDDGRKAMHNYYARNLDSEMMGQLFDEPTKQA